MRRGTRSPQGLSGLAMRPRRFASGTQGSAHRVAALSRFRCWGWYGGDWVLHGSHEAATIFGVSLGPMPMGMGESEITR